MGSGMNILKIFRNHPNSSGESYTQHLCKSLKYGFILLLLVPVTIIHGMFPFLFETTTSNFLKKIVEDVKERKKGGKEGLK